jgi:hypothetical protein
MADTQPWETDLSASHSASHPASVHLPRPRTGADAYVAAPTRVRPQRTKAQREELRVNLLLGSLAFTSLAWSFGSHFHVLG